jgi:hypothetical protein
MHTELAQTLHRVAMIDGLRLGATERGKLEAAWIHGILSGEADHQPVS